jgi:peptide/nickel transport system ATP-binding protein
MRLGRRIAVQADDEEGPILAVEGLSIALPKGADRAFAVEDASLELRRGEILCVVGE